MHQDPSVNYNFPKRGHASRVKAASATLGGRINDVLVFAGLVGLYLQIPLIIDNQPFPNIIGLITTPLLILFNLNSVKFKHVGLMFLVAFVSIVSVLLSNDYFYFLQDHLKAVALLLLSMAMGYSLYLGLISYPRKKFRNLFIILAGSILVGSALEAFTPLNNFFTRITVDFWGYNLEKNTIRDLTIAGFLRPTFLTSEPSHVAKAVAVFSVAAVLAQPTARKAMVPLSLVCGSMIVVGSPTALIAIPMILAAIVLANPENMARKQRSRKIVTAAVLSVVLGIPLLLLAANVFSERIELVQSGSDTSTLIRIVGGLDIGVRAALANPISGVGLGGIAKAEKLIIWALVESGVAYSVIVGSWEKEINNAIGAHLLQFGFIVLIFYIASWIKLLGELSRGNAKTIVVMIFFISFALGDIYSPRYIGYIFLFCVAASFNCGGATLHSSAMGFVKDIGRLNRGAR